MVGKSGRRGTGSSGILHYSDCHIARREGGISRVAAGKLNRAEAKGIGSEPDDIRRRVEGEDRTAARTVDICRPGVVRAGSPTSGFVLNTIVAPFTLKFSISSIKAR